MLRSLINRQYGNTSAKDQLSTSDCLLSQLTCHFDDEHPGIYSTSNSVLSSDLLYACRFSPAPGFEHILALANEDGKIALQNTNIIGKGRPIHGFQAHENAIFDLSWCPSTFQIVTASGDQTSVLLDIGSSTISPKAVFRGHTASVKTVDFSPLTPSIFATGSRDGAIMVWDVRGTKAENVIKNAHPVHGPTDVKLSHSKKKSSSTAVNSVTAVLFQSEYKVISSGAADSNINVWDLRKNYTVYKGDPLPTHKIPYGNLTTRSGVTSLCLNRGKTLLYVASMDDVIFEFNVASYDKDPVGIYGGHDQHSFYIKSCLSGDDNYLVSGSSDDHAYIWKIGGGPKPLLRLEGHGAEVTCVAWSPSDITKVVTCADDVRHRIWRLNPIVDLDVDERRRIRGLAVPVKAEIKMSKACEEVFSRLKKKTDPTSMSNCKTPKSVAKTRSSFDKSTPDSVAIDSKRLDTPMTSRGALTPRTTNTELTPDHRTDHAAIRDRVGASRRLEMDQSEYSSPTRNLPNSVIDGLSPHMKVRSATKRKQLDWLTDLGRRMSPTSQQKVRRIK